MRSTAEMLARRAAEAVPDPSRETAIRRDQMSSIPLKWPMKEPVLETTVQVCGLRR